MRLLSFEVQGFKNLVAPVRLADLGPINVLHGPNNVGKSNLLQAMQLFFALVGRWEPTRPVTLTDDDLAERVSMTRGEMFNVESPSPILLDGSLSLAPEDLESAGMGAFPLSLAELHVSAELRWSGEHSLYTVKRFEAAGGRDFVGVPPNDEEKIHLRQLARLLSKRDRTAGVAADRFVRIGVERHDISDLALALYDAKESPELDTTRLWDRFVEIMSRFTDILGEGRFVAIYDRRAAQANLVYQTARARIPLRQLGSGVQQIVALFGRVLTCGGSIVAVEEPELNLRWSLQERVRDALRDLVGAAGAPAQVFLTSHSGAFEDGDFFYLMEGGAGGPTVQRRPVSEAPLVVGGPVPEGSVAAPRAPTHVSSEGTLRLPDRIRKVVGVEHGGGVCFVDKGESIVEMMSVDTFLKRAGVDDDT
jgi:hypothetical protein